MHFTTLELLGLRALDEDGIDGINLRQYLSFETARDFIELVVPELRRRGRFAIAIRRHGRSRGRTPPSLEI